MIFLTKIEYRIYSSQPNSIWENKSLLGKQLLERVKFDAYLSKSTSRSHSNVHSGIVSICMPVAKL